jgi:L-2-hydroxyglutarate oxidase LhgO
MDYEVTIIGGGIVGCAVANVFSQKYETILLEKNHDIGLETSSRSGEVIHTGINYLDHPLKGQCSLEGNKLMYELCEKHNIPHRKWGKLILAQKGEEEVMESLYKKGVDAGIELKILDKADVHKLEPEVTATGAIWSPNTGIIDSRELIKFYQGTSNANFVMNTKPFAINKIKNGYEMLVQVKNEIEMTKITTNFIINAAGLNSDKVAQLCGVNDPNYEIYYCKGNYFSIGGGKNKIISHLIYPMPGPVSQGFHVKLELDHSMKIGPDTRYIERDELNYDVDENVIPDIFKFTQNYLKFIELKNISAAGYSGVRPKLQKKGEPSRDWIIREESDRGLEGLVNYIGIDSPGITGAMIAARYGFNLIKTITI